MSDKNITSFTLDFGDVVFTTENHQIFNECPILPAKKMYPDWIKNIPKHSAPTLKSCPGVINLYNYGYILPAWTDMKFILHNNATYEFECADSNTFAFSHPKEEYYGFWDNFVQIKIISPWEIKTVNKKTLVIEPTWNYSESCFRIVPGIADTDRKFHCTNVQAFFEIKDYTRIIEIKKNEPLLHFILI
jgi:hypothetical protein